MLAAAMNDENGFVEENETELFKGDTATQALKSRVSDDLMVHKMIHKRGETVENQKK